MSKKREEIFMKFKDQEREKTVEDMADSRSECTILDESTPWNIQLAGYC